MPDVKKELIKKSVKRQKDQITKKETVIETSSNDTCLICKEDCETKLLCGHFYHHRCISMWFDEINASNKKTTAYKCCYCSKKLLVEEIIKIVDINSIDLHDILIDDNIELVKHIHKIYPRKIYGICLNCPCRNNDIKIIKFLYEIDIKLEKHHLNLAIQCNNLDIGKFLISTGIKPTKHTLELAIKSGNYNSVLYLISLKCKVDIQMLNIAASSGNYKIFMLLKSMGVSITVTTLDLACISGSEEIVEYIILSNAYKNEFQKHAKDVINTAIKYENIDIVKLLLKHNFSFDETSMLIAINNEDYEMIDFLKDNNCPYSKKDILESAHNFEIFDMLLNIDSIRFQNQAEEYMIKAAEVGSEDIIELFIENEYEISYQIIKTAVVFNKINILRYCNDLEFKFPDESSSEYLVYLACELGHLDIVMYLMKNNYNVSKDCVDIAGENEKYDVVKYIFENSDINFESFDREWLFEYHMYLDAHP